MRYIFLEKNFIFMTSWFLRLRWYCYSDVEQCSDKILTLAGEKGGAWLCFDNEYNEFYVTSSQNKH